MNRHLGQSVTYQQIGDSVNHLYTDIDENAVGSEEENSPSNIQ